MKSVFVLILSFILLSEGPLVAQKPIWKDIALKEEINLFSLNKDTIGFIWGISDLSLFKYDGLKMQAKMISKDESSSFASFSTDRHHNFLIGTVDGQLLKYSPYTDHLDSTKLRLNDIPVTHIDCQDADQNCLLISYGNGVMWQNEEMDTLLTTDNILISNEVYASVMTNDQIMLATDQGIQIITIDGKLLSSQVINKQNGLGDVIISNLIQDNGYLWASNFDSQIYQIDLSTLIPTTFELPERSRINGVKIIDENIPYVFTNLGIYVLENDKWYKKFPESGNQEVMDIEQDEENNLWVCSPNNVISKGHLGFQLIPNTVDKAQSILKTDGEFWIGSPEGLFLVNGIQKTKILDNNITCLRKINDDIIVGTFSSGILVLDDKGNKIGAIDGWAENPNQSVLYIYDKDGELLVSSLTGVAKMTLTKSSGKYSMISYENLNDVIDPGYVYQILENDGVLYFATDRQGIKILKGDSIRHVTHFQNGNPLGSIYSMTKCKAGRIWISSSIGYIGYIENGIVKHVDNERFLQDPYTSLITSTDQKIILARNSSIDIYDPNTDHFVYYNDLIQSLDAELYLNSFFQEGDSIWLAIPNGVLQIGHFKNQKTYPESIINQVMVNLIEVENENNFAEDQNNLEFRYSAAWMTDPERILYQYKLEGWHDNWVTTRDQTATYPRLRPGNYTFRVRASEDGNFSNASEKIHQFSIHRFFHKTWWFISLLFLLLAGLYWKWRSERKKVRLQKEDLNRKRIEAQLISLQTQLNPHFLFNSFNTLIGLIEENPAKGIIFTEKLTDFYRNILDMGKNDLIQLREESELLNTYIHLIKERFGDQLHIDVQLNDLDTYTIPPLTLQLLIENAVKHNVASTKKPLYIEVKQIRNKIRIKNAISPKFGDSKGTGIGLKNIKKRHTLKNLKPPKIEKSDTHFIVTIYLNKIEE